MSELTVLRVEVSSAGESNEGSLKSGKTNGSTGTSLAAGGVAGKLTTVGLSSKKERTAKGDELLKQMYPNTKPSSEQLAINKNMKEMFGYDAPKRLEISKQGSALRRFNTPSAKQVGTVAGAGIALAATGYKMYSAYKIAGYEMSGSTHAAAMQSRKVSAAGSLQQIGGAMIINPALAAPMIAMQAYQLAQTNRKQLFEIQKSQIMSQVLQRNLVNTVAERRF